MNKVAITGKERMEASFEGKKLDRVPVLLLLGGHYAEKAGFTLEQFLTQPEAALETAKLTCKELDSDVMFVPLNPLMPDAIEAFRKLLGKLPSIKKEDIKMYGNRPGGSEICHRPRLSDTPSGKS